MQSSLRRPSFPRHTSPLEGDEKVLKQVQRAHGDLLSKGYRCGGGEGRRRKEESSCESLSLSLRVTGTENEKNPCGC